MTSDGFNSKNLNAAVWTFLAPNGGGYTMSGTHLRLNVHAWKNHDPAFAGDLPQMDNAVRVRQAMGAEDFTVIVRFDTVPFSGYSFEGVIVEQDDQHYLRFQLGAAPDNSLVCNVDFIIAGQTITGPRVDGIAVLTSSFWMSVGRAGGVWSYAYSLDGVNWVPVGTFSQPVEGKFIGPFAGNYSDTPGAAPAFYALVNSFNIVSL